MTDFYLLNQLIRLIMERRRNERLRYHPYPRNVRHPSYTSNNEQGPHHSNVRHGGQNVYQAQSWVYDASDTSHNNAQSTLNHHGNRSARGRRSLPSNRGQNFRPRSRWQKLPSARSSYRNQHGRSVFRRGRPRASSAIDRQVLTIIEPF